MEGALSLALPLKKGQSLSIVENNSKLLRWQANKPDGIWFTAEYELPSLKIVATDNESLANKLKEILIVAKAMSGTFLSDSIGYNVTTNLDFNPDFGFGTSSTLISNIATWANINSYLLLQNTFGGSGYDIACARSSNPILYQVINEEIKVEDINFNPPFKDNLYFVYLGKKQSSSEEIAAFKMHGKFTSSDIDSISDITKELILTKDLVEFERLLTEHEKIISKVLKLPTVKSLYFPDYSGAVKSLGAWGGDFVLVTNHETEDHFRNYILSKGFDTVSSYDDLVL